MPLFFSAHIPEEKGKSRKREGSDLGEKKDLDAKGMKEISEVFGRQRNVCHLCSAWVNQVEVWELVIWSQF